MSKNFIIKIYTPFEAVLLGIISLVAGTALLICLDLKWDESILKILLLMIMLVLGWIGQRLATVTINLELNKEGIFLTGYRSLFGIGRQNESIYWSTIKEWTYQEGHLTAHAWSPTTFSIQQNNGKKRTLYVLNNAHNIKLFEVFLIHFQLLAHEMNLKNQGIAHIKQGDSGKIPKIVAILISLLFVGTSLFMAWFLLWNPLPESWDFPKGFNVIYIIVFSLFSVWITKTAISKAWEAN